MEGGSDRRQRRRARSARSRLPVGRLFVMRGRFRGGASKERFENRRNAWKRNICREIAVRHAPLAMLRGGGHPVAVVFVLVGMGVGVPVVMLFERLVEHHVYERHDVEAEKPKHAGQRGPLSSSGAHRLSFRPCDRRALALAGRCPLQGGGYAESVPATPVGFLSRSANPRSRCRAAS